MLAHRAPRETVIAALDLLFRAGPRHHLLNQKQQLARLRLQLVERVHQNIAYQLAGQLDIGRRGLDVFERFAAARVPPDFPLVLVQQRNRLDQGQELHVIAPGTRAVGGEAHFERVRVGDRKRTQQPLRVAMHGKDVDALLACPESLQRLRLALLLVNRPRLRLVLVHRQHHATVQQLFVDVDGRRGQEDHHRTLDPVFMRAQTARVRVLAGRGDAQLAFRLQQLQRVGGAACALLFRDGQDFMFQILFAHVKQRLPGHRRVLHPVLCGNKGQHRIHQ